MIRQGGHRAAPKVFRADHPFFFLIRDLRTGSILFLGRLVRPESLSYRVRSSLPEPLWIDRRVGAAGRAGSRTVNRAPRPGSDSTSMVPPCDLTMPWLIASPRPVPWPIGLVVKNGSKIRPRIVGSMPQPASVTSGRLRPRARTGAHGHGPAGIDRHRCRWRPGSGRPD